MKYLFKILPLLLVVAFAAVGEAAARNDVMLIEGQAAPLGPQSQPKQTAGQQGVVPQAPSTKPGQSTTATVFRDIPSISGSYSVGGTTLMPYLGAGFGNGYASELDRSLNSHLSPNTETGLRSQFGQSFAPNEFQMGIRIPF
ncbi:MAG TPA: hypothetical protein VKP13_04395 [Nitrospira sp.]|nr:hypothetical protein [Nitrospira sp.]